ncbi:MAG: glycosyltransferase [Desulfomonilaceae bacterium]
MEMIHLAIDAIGVKHGGTASVLIDILNAVVEDPRVSKITLFCSPREKRHFKIPNSDKLIEAPKPWVDSNYLLRVLWFEWFLGLECRRIGADILLSASNCGKAGLGMPHVTFVQQSLPFSEEAITSFRSILKTIKISAIRWEMMRSCCSAARVICQSFVMMDWLTDAFNLDPAKVQAIYSTPRLLGPSQLKKSFSSEKHKVANSCRLLYVGDDYPYKRLDTVVKSLKLIRRRFPKVELTLTLPKDHSYASIPGVNCIGYLGEENLAQAYFDADILVLPSLVETVGLPTLEAMSLGTPVLVADRPYAHDVCDNAALFFDPLSPEDLAEKAIVLLTDQTLRKTLIDRGFALIEGRRSEKPYQKIVDILIEVGLQAKGSTYGNLA